jgi:hypothetical protein
MARLRSVIVATALIATPALAAGQQLPAAPKVEFGMDLALQYSKPSGGDGFFHLGTPLLEGEVEMVTVPVALRLGFLSEGPLAVEARLSAGLTTTTGSSSRTYYAVAPGINLVRRVGGKSASDNTYVTGGASVQLFGASGSGNSQSYAFITFNGGLGMRRPWGSGASRVEGFVAYTLKNDKAGTPNILHFGVRLGFSLFR